MNFQLAICLRTPTIRRQPTVSKDNFKKPIVQIMVQVRFRPSDETSGHACWLLKRTQIQTDNVDCSQFRPPAFEMPALHLYTCQMALQERKFNVCLKMCDPNNGFGVPCFLLFFPLEQHYRKGERASKRRAAWKPPCHLHRLHRPARTRRPSGPAAVTECQRCSGPERKSPCLYFPGISCPFSFFAFLGLRLFSTRQNIYFLLGS